MDEIVLATCHSILFRGRSAVLAGIFFQQVIAFCEVTGKAKKWLASPDRFFCCFRGGELSDVFVYCLH